MVQQRCWCKGDISDGSFVTGPAPYATVTWDGTVNVSGPGTVHEGVDVDEEEADVDLLRAAGGGEPAAVEALVRRHTPALLRLARAVVQDPGLAEDVVQDSWVAAFRAAGSFEGRSSVRSWLLTICANAARTQRRREQRVLPFSTVWKDERSPAVETGLFTGSGGWAAPVTPWDDAPHEQAAARLLRQALEDAIEGLPSRLRAVVVAIDVLHCTPEQTADLLGITSGHQRVLLHQARVRLRRVLEPYRQESR